jgi:hypothetical protein
VTDRLHASQRNWGARVRDGAYQGVRAVTLENERLRVTVLAGKGSDIVEINYKPRDMDFAWLAPGGVRDPAIHALTAPDSRAAFRENYPGGWQEIFPNGGAPSVYDGAHHGQHGEVFNVPWDVSVVEDTEDVVAVRFAVRTRKVPCVLEKILHLRSGDACFRIEERLRNESPVPVRVMWGHHITFGPPFLVPGSRIHLPPGITVVPHPEDIAPGGRRLSGTDPFPWPRDPGNALDLSVIPDWGAPSDQVYLTGFRHGEAWYEVMRPEGDLGARIAWDAEQMPFAWFWQEFGASTGYPWYGRNYNIGLEPFSSAPSLGLAEAVANGSALTLAPGEERRFWLTMSIVDRDGQPPGRS